MAKCKKCGTELIRDASFCHVCGEPVKRGIIEEFSVSTEELVGKVKKILEEGNVNRIIVKNEAGDTLLEIPVTIGVVGALLAPYLAALGVIAAIATKCEITVERRT